MTLLILNADDFGRDDRTTDAISECFRSGTISSTTAMVNMSGTERGARISRAEGFAVGLHLNLTEPFDAPNVSSDMQARQLELVRKFKRLRLKGTRLHAYQKRWVDRPHLRGLVDQAVQDQFDTFRSVFGHEPTHLDGHHHVHLTPTVLRSTAIPEGMPIRNTRRRGVRQSVIERRFTCPDAFISIRQLSAPWGHERLSHVVGRERPRAPRPRSTLISENGKCCFRTHGEGNSSAVGWVIRRPMTAVPPRVIRTGCGSAGRSAS